MDASSRSFGRFGCRRCDGPTAFRPIRVRAHSAAPRELAKEITAGWGNPSAGDAESPTGRVPVAVAGFDDRQEYLRVHLKRDVKREATRTMRRLL